MNKNYLLKTLITAFIILSVSTLLYLYTAGYRLEKGEEEPVDIRITGMISAKSIPESASVYLNDKLVTATNDSIPGIEPGKYDLKITKSGFVPWKKEIEVYPELVTDITAVLISQTPRIEPLTNTGARNPVMAPSLSAIAYFSQDEENPGVWVMPLIYNRLSFFSATPSVVLEDTTYVKFSEGLGIFWSPDEKQLLVQQNETDYYLVDLVSDSARSLTTDNLEELLTKWEKERLEIRENAIEKADLTEEIKEKALAKESNWAPDNKKFLYAQNNGRGQIEYHVYNLEKPLPVGEKAENTVLTTVANDPQPKLSWYADSFHLIMVEIPDQEQVSGQKSLQEKSDTREEPTKGRVSLIRIDGSNKTEIYNNNIFSNAVYSSPGGDKIILLTSFRSEGQTNLYTVSIR